MKNNQTIRSFNQKGFTLIELLVVIAIVGVLVGVIFVALNPAARFQQARDSVRQNAVQEILSAIKLHQVDNGGTYLASIAALTAGNTFMITGQALGVGCNSTCDAAITSGSSCVDLAGLATAGYLKSVPISPKGVTTWDIGSSKGTGFALSIDTNGLATVTACESEATATPTISASR
ncbi:MAG: type II secretion system protein [Patescibacteria group bacterium]